MMSSTAKSGTKSQRGKDEDRHAELFAPMVLSHRSSSKEFDDDLMINYVRPIRPHLSIQKFGSYFNDKDGDEAGAQRPR